MCVTRETSAKRTSFLEASQEIGCYFPRGRMRGRVCVRLPLVLAIARLMMRQADREILVCAFYTFSALYAKRSDATCYTSLLKEAGYQALWSAKRQPINSAGPVRC